MSRRNQTFVCQNCGAASARWQGKCEACGEWNTLVEEGDGTAASPAGRPARPRAAQGPQVRARAAGRRDRTRPLACRPAWPNSTASPAAASCAARCC